MSRSKRLTAAEAALQNAGHTDIAIPIMGATGAGKSSLINKLLSSVGHQSRVKVGEDLASCTVNLETIIIENETTPKKGYVHIRGHRVYLVDTPGFDDTSASDFEILRRIASWLELSFKKGMILGGVIYLHDISQDRFSGTARRNLEMFNHLCGDAALSKVVLVTSKWSRDDGKRNFEKRQQELETRHWKWMLDGGADVMRLQGNEKSSAYKILHSILRKVEERANKRVDEAILEIQDELGQKEKYLAETAAAVELRNQLKRMVEAQQQMMELERKAAEGDPEAEAKLAEMQEKLEAMADQIDKLKLTFGQRLSKFRRGLMFWRR